MTKLMLLTKLNKNKQILRNNKLVFNSKKKGFLSILIFPCLKTCL